VRKQQSVSDSRPDSACYLISVPMKRSARPEEIAPTIAFSPGEKRPSAQAGWEGQVIFRGCLLISFADDHQLYPSGTVSFDVS